MIVTKEKVRHWIYTLIFLALLGYGAWFLLLRSSGLTMQKLDEIYQQQQSAFDNVSKYLSDNKISAEITHLLTIDEDLGIRGEDSPAYRAFTDGLERLYEKDLSKIICKDGNVTFCMQGEGGLMVRQHAILFYPAKDGKSSYTAGDGSIVSRIASDHWYGCISDAA